jgi:hypothetical protein
MDPYGLFNIDWDWQKGARFDVDQTDGKAVGNATWKKIFALLKSPSNVSVVEGPKELFQTVNAAIADDNAYVTGRCLYHAHYGIHDDTSPTPSKFAPAHYHFGLERDPSKTWDFKLENLDVDYRSLFDLQSLKGIRGGSLRR